MIIATVTALSGPSALAATSTAILPYMKAITGLEGPTKPMALVIKPHKARAAVVAKKKSGLVPLVGAGSLLACTAYRGFNQSFLVGLNLYVHLTHAVHGLAISIEEPSLFPSSSWF